MAITLRSNSNALATTKGSALSHDEMDANFTSSVLIYGNQTVQGNKTFNGVVGVNQSVFITGSLSVGFSAIESAVAGRIDAANDVVVFSTSDENLKDNIRLIETPLNKVNSIKGVKFEWKEEPEYFELHGFSGTDVGVIAQDIEKVLPEAVSDKIIGYKGVRYEKLIPLLVEAIKELDSKVKRLEDIVTGG